MLAKLFGAVSREPYAEGGPTVTRFDDGGKARRDGIVVGSIRLKEKSGPQEEV